LLTEYKIIPQDDRIIAVWMCIPAHRRLQIANASFNFSVSTKPTCIICLKQHTTEKQQTTKLIRIYRFMDFNYTYGLFGLKKLGKTLHS